MKTVQEIVDINAHIKNLSWSVVIKDDVPFAIISFENLSYGNIIAIKFSANGYNSFGDSIIVNGQETFDIVIQDINVRKNEISESISVQLPDKSIRRIVLEEKQVCFSDGKIVEYEGKCEKNIEYEKFENSSYSDQEIIISLKQYLNKNFICKPKEFEFGWLCGCGFLNNKYSKVCHNCYSGKDSAFESCTEEKLLSITEKYKKEQQERIRREQAEREEREKQKKKINIKISIALIIVLIVSIFIIDSCIISSRVTYETEGEMKEVLQGVWVCRSETLGNALLAIRIQDNTITKYYYSDSEGYSDKVEFNNKRGYFSTEGDKYILKKEDGRLVLHEDNYKYKSGSLDSLGRDPESESYKDDMLNAKIEASAYCRRLKSKQANINSAWVTGNGTCSGSYYFYDCTVTYTNGDMKFGTITVYKNTSGRFEATGLSF